jgi:hypothetical protein
MRNPLYKNRIDHRPPVGGPLGALRAPKIVPDDFVLRYARKDKKKASSYGYNRARGSRSH